MSRIGVHPRRAHQLRRRRALAPWTEALETRQLLASFLVSSTADSGPNTLRQAILDANASPNASDANPDVIVFDFTGLGGGHQVITVTSPLPAITDPVVIDGYSAPGSSINKTPVGLDEQETDVAVINVQIDAPGVSPTAALPGLITVVAPNTTIDGLSLTRFNGPAIALLPPPNSPTGSVGDSIWGNFIGVPSFNPNSFNDLPLGPNTPVDPNLWTHINPWGNSVGILVQSSNNRIGGTLPSSRNVIMGNHGDGVQFAGPHGTGNLLEGNFILDNDAYGVHITTSNNLIGEAIGAGPAGGGNVISGNNYGVAIIGPSATGNILVNNEIGTELGLAGVQPGIRGLNPRPNRYDGVLIEDAPGNIVGGLLQSSRNVIAANGLDGVSIQNRLTKGATGNVVQGNFIGYNLRGGVISILPNRDGVNISSANNTIGGTSASARNTIASNARNGITISSMALDISNLSPVPIPNAQPTGNFIAGNYIGTEGGGDDFGNTLNGILIEDASGNTVGGTISGAQNVISGNNDGVVINDDTPGHLASTGNVIAGNIIGLMSDGVTPLPNSVDGVRISNASGNTVGGTVAAAANVLSGNNIGLHFTGAAARNNRVQGNYIGTASGGGKAARNSVDGILIDGGASQNTIGGTSAATRNIISGNNTGVVITDAASTGNILSGNFIGVAADGVSAIPNSVYGVRIASPSNTVGGTVAGAANVISGNFVGIYLIGPSATANLINGNLIGTDLTGAGPAGNTSDGILIDGGAGNNTIGGAGIVDGNVIAFNGGNGVNEVTGIGNSILSNAIFQNVLLGINFPGTSAFLTSYVVVSALSNGVNSTAIEVQLTSPGQATFLLQFFNNPANLPPEGQTLIGSQTVTTNGSSPTTFTITIPSALIAGQQITFTATATNSSTSQFSNGATVQSASQPQTFIVTNTNDSGSGSLRDAVDQANQTTNLMPGLNDQIIFAIPNPGQQTISLLSPLFVTAPVSIQGFTQPGSSPNSLGVGFNGVINVRLDGHLAQLDQNQIGTYPVQGLLTIAAINCQVSGLSITGYMNGPAILLAPVASADSGAIGDTISGNLIGQATLVSTVATTPPPSNPLGNLLGIRVQSSRNSIGGTSVGAGNVIQGNNGVGLKFDGPSGTGNVVDGNAIVNNVSDGILINSANNIIGEEIAPATNLIAGNGGNGVHIQGPNARGNVVGFNGGANVLVVAAPSSGIIKNFGHGVLIEDAPGNIIETNFLIGNVGDGVRVMNTNANTAVDNSILNNDIESNRDGINISSANNTVSDLNLILTNRRNGVTISSTELDANNNNLGAIPNAQPSGNVVSGNMIGTRDGNANNGNTLNGVFINAAGNNTIGGTDGNDRNVISGNNNGVVIRGAQSVGNLLQGNYIGAKAVGTAVLPNAVDGVRIENASNNTIGGTSGLAPNVISGNNVGVHFTGPGTTGNVVLGNFIGTDFQGIGPVRNSNEGVLFDGNASNNTLGGTAAGAGNTIAFNVSSGVVVASGTGNSILSNSIFSNVRIGIDLVAPGDPANGVTPLQVTPASGPNNLVNYPTLIFAATDGEKKTGIQGNFLGASGGTYLIQFFSTPSADPSGHGQGKTFIGSITVTLPGSNPNQFVTAGFVANLPVVVQAGQYISATATADDGSTSEFSNTVPISAVQVGFSAGSYVVNQAAGTATITVVRGGSAGATQGTVTVDYAVGGGTAVAGTNYVPVSGTLTFNPGDVAKTITIPVINNPAVAPDTTVNITLGNATGGATIATPNPVTLTITNSNVPEVHFSLANYSVSESGGSATITVTRNTGAGTARVHYATSNGTAQAGVDYTAVSGDLNFANGQTTQTFTVPVINTHKAGGSGTVNLILSGATGAGLGTPSTATLTINYDEAVGAFQFNNVSYGANATADSAFITVNRIGGAGGTATVHYATGGGTAIPGQDYDPTSGTLTFGPGELSKTFTVQIRNHQITSAVTVGLTLSAPTGGASLGPVATATLSIAQNTFVPPVRAGATPGAVITNFQLQTAGPAITGIALSFNKALEASRAQNLSNYGYYIISAGGDNVFGTSDDYSVAIASAQYNAGTFQVLLTPSAPLAAGQLYKIGINTQASVPLQTGLTDTSGNLLDGSYTGGSGTPYVTQFALGSRLGYVDGAGNRVNLQLSRGGLMSLQLAANGNAQVLRVLGPVPGKSTLAGQVRGKRRASTTIPVIEGAAGVRIRLNPRSFHIGRVSPAAVDALFAGRGR